jgi:sulfide:quinone oxidoreductase
MDAKKLSDELSVSAQVMPQDMAALKQAGFRSIICNRPDGEAADQPSARELESAASARGIEFAHLPVVPGRMSDDDAAQFGRLLKNLAKPTLAFCRTGTRSVSLWCLANAPTQPLPVLLDAAKAAGYDMSGIVRRIANGGKTPLHLADASYDVVIVGGGAAGIAFASSLLARAPNLGVAVIDPADIHYYQPGWTMVGDGVFDAASTVHTMAAVVPSGVTWIKAAVTAFEPAENAVILEGCRVVKYSRLVVCPGL